MTGQIEPRDESGEYRAPLNTLASKLALGEPSGPAPSLSDALRRFRDAQALASALPADPLAKAAVKPANVAAEVEKHAIVKAKKSIRKARAKGLEPAEIAAAGYRKYKKHGGKKALGGFLEELK